MNTGICRSSSCNNKMELINIRENQKNPGQFGGNCPSCNKITWLPLEKNKDKRPASQKGCKEFLQNNGYNNCYFCGLHKDNFPKGITLECAHIIWYKDGGEFSKDNILPLCTRCHKLQHHIQHWWITQL